MSTLAMVVVLGVAAGGALAAAELAGPPAGRARDADAGRGPAGAARAWSEPVATAGEPRGLPGAGDALLEALAGARGRNRLAVCGGSRARRPPGPPLPQRCPAVLWRGRWALARASCVVGLALGEMRLMRTNNHERTCDAYDHDPVRMSGRARRVVSGRLAPLWRAGAGRDAALLELDPPYADEDPLANATVADYYLFQMKCWMELVDSEYRNKVLAFHQLRGASTYTLFMMGFLPALALFIFFLFVTFGTGSPIRAPYSNEKEGIKTPWMVDSYASDVKCYPTYGKV